MEFAFLANIAQQGDFYWGFYWVIDWRLRGNNYKKYIYSILFGQKDVVLMTKYSLAVGGVLRCQKNVSIYDHLIWVFLHLIAAGGCRRCWSFLILKSDRFLPPTLDFFQWHMLKMGDHDDKKVTHEGAEKSSSSFTALMLLF